MSTRAISRNQEQAKRKPRTGREAAALALKDGSGQRTQSRPSTACGIRLEVALTPRQVAEAKRHALSLQKLVAAKRSEMVSVERRMLVQILDLLRLTQVHDTPRATRGAPVVPHSENDEISPQDAAGMLGMSRPSVMRLIEQGHLHTRKVHSHHRLSAAAVVAYARQNARQRASALDELGALSQELDI